MHSCHLHAPLCGIFAPNSGCVARYAPFIRDKSTTNCDAHLSESNFQTRSSRGSDIETSPLPEIHGAGYRIRYFCKDFNPASV
ncbi:DUF6783 domain-containing protein [uncultured Robinsoniella sp.]|uniref:DUF6783 domain-containing protein n=1 Tax=Robinsoniella peoriensis TaxID=180332 RepID=UPI00374EFA54